MGLGLAIKLVYRHVDPQRWVRSLWGPVMALGVGFMLGAAFYGGPGPGQHRLTYGGIIFAMAMALLQRWAWWGIPRNVTTDEPTARLRERARRK
jgi:hypothetical protein